ncbi:iron complex transport system substrate-binding protein [Pseudonocardia autotrophica]|uniref:Fe(3+)-citrate-binding protein YfmC n=2 Tax=Pseudonocardia TaxID=1847 RepID=A0A1Y2N345_PSEAH|nr:Fe(3+)-citrate-binding protein YfmC precursor [Pseudonocardia autotrophica]TDN71088.1 iron complex transport system substrate-binding protein [Pseudonocardia autotrophica]GEC26293.1 hypothetical protein PSA01_33220 [Pseudonocardia saturnea]
MLAGAGLLTACGPGTARSGPGADRVVETAEGPVTVPVRPQRVVTLGAALAGHLTSVGLVPVGAQEGHEEWLGAYAGELPEGTDIDGIATVGLADAPNLETIVGLDPELVLIERSAGEHIRELSAIAPTVVVDRPSNAAWKAAFDATVGAADREAEAEQVRERYRAALAAVPDAARERSVTFLRGQGDGAFRIDGSGAFGGSVAAEAGLTVRDGAGRGEPSEHGYIGFSIEELMVADGDLLVVPDRAGGPSSVENLMANPLWERLPAVRAGRVLSLPNAVYNGGTYLGAELLLRELTAALR